jgi:hypothetical protein
VVPIAGEPGDWLRAVRAGHVPLTEWEDRTRELDARLAALADDDSIPATADRDALVQWSSEVHRSLGHVKIAGRLPRLMPMPNSAHRAARDQPRGALRIRSSSRRRRLLGRPAPRTALMPGAISRITGGGVLSM